MFIYNLCKNYMSNALSMQKNNIYTHYFETNNIYLEKLNLSFIYFGKNKYFNSF